MAERSEKFGVTRMRAAELSTWAERAGVELSIDDLHEYEILLDALFDIIEPVGSLAQMPLTEVAGKRDGGKRPSQDDDPLNAIVRSCAISLNIDGPLSGKRVAIKDNIAVAGVPMTAGSDFLRYVPSADSVVVARLLRAGAEIVAITNMDALAFSGGGETSSYGPTLNPWDASRTAAGSSGGSAAALFYDAVDISLGTDDGGSIRLPAAWCAALGLKPTHGLIPYTGIVSTDQSFAHVGPLARTVEELTAALAVLAGSDVEASDPRQRDISVDDYVRAVREASDDLSGVRIAVVSDALSEGAGVEKETVDATTEAIERMRASGADVRFASIPEHLELGGLALAMQIEGVRATFDGYGNGYQWAGQYSVELGSAFSEALAERRAQLPPAAKIALIIGSYLHDRHGSQLYFRGQTLRARLRGAYDRALLDADFLIMPTATKRAHKTAPQATLSERVLRGWACMANTAPFNVTGHPALSIPAGQAGGLPVGVMVVGSRFSEARMLAFARTYERLHGWLPAGTLMKPLPA